MLASDIANDLLNIEAVKVSMDPPFTWVSGMKSPIYCDNRLLISCPEERTRVVEGFKQLLQERGLNPDIIAGTATAAIPWAAFVAYDLNLPMVYIRPEKKEHGAGKQIEGMLKEGQKVVIIEDLISTGGSSVRSAQAVQEEGKGIVTDVLAIMTYELKKAEQTFSEAGLSLTTLTNFTHLMGEAVKRGVVTEEQKAKVLEFREDPASWGAKMGLA